MLEKEYTKDEIKRAKELFKILFPEKYDKPEAIFITAHGKKSNTGVINLILNIMYNNILV